MTSYEYKLKNKLIINQSSFYIKMEMKKINKYFITENKKFLNFIYCI